MKKFVAFTLAETLIVIGVIGIVSALALPNLNSSTGDKEIVTKVKKVYQNLNDAFGRAEAVYGPYGEWFINDTRNADKTKRAGERITEFMKLSKNCGMNANQGCIQNRDNDASISNYKVITADGISMSFIFANGYIVIETDIDGPSKGSYSNGKDIFFFTITEDGVDTNKHSGTCLSERFTVLVGEVTERRACASNWIIKYDNADYLQFNKRGECKNGNTVTEDNPRCK